MSYGRGHETGSRRQPPRPLPECAQQAYAERIRILEAEEQAWRDDQQRRAEEEDTLWQQQDAAEKDGALLGAVRDRRPSTRSRHTRDRSGSPRWASGSRWVLRSTGNRSPGLPNRHRRSRSHLPCCYRSTGTRPNHGARYRNRHTRRSHSAIDRGCHTGDRRRRDGSGNRRLRPQESRRVHDKP